MKEFEIHAAVSYVSGGTRYHDSVPLHIFLFCIAAISFTLKTATQWLHHKGLAMFSLQVI